MHQTTNFLLFYQMPPQIPQTMLPPPIPKCPAAATCPSAVKPSHSMPLIVHPPPQSLTMYLNFIPFLRPLQNSSRPLSYPQTTRKLCDIPTIRFQNLPNPSLYILQIIIPCSFLSLLPPFLFPCPRPFRILSYPRHLLQNCFVPRPIFLRPTLRNTQTTS